MSAGERPGVDSPAGARSSETFPRAGAFARIRLAAGFLTILPVLPHGEVSAETVAGSFGWFPLVGFALSSVLVLENLVLLPAFGKLLSAVLLVLTMTALTGAVHLDALADTADALGAGMARERALEIMRDSRIGAFGAVAIFFFLAIEIAALASMRDSSRIAALWLAPGLARWAMVAVAWRMDYLRAAGAGAALIGPGENRSSVLACAIAVVASALVPEPRTLLACTVAIVIAWIVRGACRRWLGGVTGDLLGAAGELAEAAVLLAIAAI
jgi:adenosylcobinamide-GDP ribazoletransferase